MYIEFIKKIFKKWFGIFSLIASVSGLTLFYTGIDTNNFIVNFITNNWLTVSLIFLLISAYQVWTDTKQEKITLEDKLKNPIDYEIEGLIQKVVVDFQYLDNLYENNIKEVEKSIFEVDNEIDELSNRLNNSSSSIQLESLRSLSFSLSGMDNNQKSDSLYLTELKEYKSELEEYSNKKNDFISAWESFLNNDLKNLYYIDFQIKNIGIKSDEDIDINISYKNATKYITTPNRMSNFPRANIPIKPKQETYSQLTHVFDRDFNGTDMHRNIMDSNPQVFRRYEEIEENHFSVKLRDLKVSKTVRIFRQKGFFISLENKDDIEVTIISKNSTSAIHKKIIYTQLDDYEYFKESISINE